MSKQVLTDFGAVTHFAKVYLVCERKGGFLPFEVGVSSLLVPGKNLLAVAVDNTVNHCTLPVGSETGGNMLGGLLPEIPGIRTRRQNHPNFDFFNYVGYYTPG